MYYVCKQIVEAQANELLKRVLYDAVSSNKCALIENSEAYRGQGKTTLIKELANYFDAFVYTGRTNLLYEKDKMIRKLEDLRGRKRGLVLIDCDVVDVEEGIVLIEKIRELGFIPIGFVNVLRGQGSCISLV